MSNANAQKEGGGTLAAGRPQASGGQSADRSFVAVQAILMKDSHFNISYLRLSHEGNTCWYVELPDGWFCLEPYEAIRKEDEFARRPPQG